MITGRWLSQVFMKIVLLLPLVLASLIHGAHGQEVESSVASRFEHRNARVVPDFQKHVVPLLGRLGCNSASCHGSFQGQGGFQLSLFGFDFRADHAAVTATAESRDGTRINVKDAKQSLLVLKPSRQVDHEGGIRFKQDSWEHHLLLRWIESGARGAELKKPALQVTEKNPGFSGEGLQLFRERIQPLLENNCYECHGYNNPKAGLSVRLRDSVLEGGKSGAAVVPGNPDRSLLIQAVRHTGKVKMPPSGKLVAREIADLERWVQMGAPWPSGSSGSQAGDTDLVLAKLHCEPSEIRLEKNGDVSQIRVIAEWANGEREDVTCLSRFQSNDEGVFRVDPDGRVTSVGKGDSHVVVFYDNGVTAIPVLRPYQEAEADSILVQKPQGIGKLEPVDRFVNEKLRKLGLVASVRCTDAEFLRRVSIDMTGSLPTPDEVRQFLADRSADKRGRKIDELLERSTYAAWWANKLCDFTGCNPASIRGLLEVATESGYVQASQWYDWIYERVRRNEPYDKLVEGIMLADLSGRGVGMPTFWTRQSLKEPKDTAMSVAHAFLGIQLQCAECHKHPFDRWTQVDFSDFSLFFEGVTRSKRSVASRQTKDLLLLRSHVVQLGPGDDPRKPVMQWMRDRDNPWFARAFVNRVWAGYFHVGIVDPPDQFTPANPPSNPALLDWLTEGFVEAGYDMKWLHRQITRSEAYQRSWKPNATNQQDRRNFSRAIPRRIPAEVIYDAMKQSTAARDKLVEVRTNLQRRASGHLSMRMAGTHAMRVFGKPDRSINCDCERVNEPTLLQAIFVQNDPLVRMRLAESGWIIEIEEAEEEGKPLDRRNLIEQVWLRSVNRLPTDQEIERAVLHLESVKQVSEGIRDLLWAMMNSKEYLLNH
jgi:hypothetical protein